MKILFAFAILFGIFTFGLQKVDHPVARSLKVQIGEVVEPISEKASPFVKKGKRVLAFANKKLLAFRDKVNHYESKDEWTMEDVYKRHQWAKNMTETKEEEVENN